jgi:hypothetical protein
LIDYLRWAELHLYMTVHELSLTCTRQSGQGPNRYRNRPTGSLDFKSVGLFERETP